MASIDWGGKWDRLVADSRRPVVAESLPFPTDAQLDLLKAALMPPEQAGPAWRRWRGRGLELQTVSDDSTRLFPLLWANREAAGIGPEDRELLKGVCRKAFVDNAAKLSAALDTARILSDAGIPALFLKGAALIAIADDGLGLRRMADVDIIVPAPVAERATAALLAAGFSSLKGPPDFTWKHAWHCVSPEGYEIDLHWSAFKPPGDDGSMFDTAQWTNLLGRPVLVPTVTECLLVAIANAFCYGGTPVRWIADSMVMFRTAPIDWDVVLRRSSRPGVLPAVTHGLAFLAREFEAPVPSDVLDALRRRPISWQARTAYWVSTRHPIPDLYYLVGRLESRWARRLQPHVHPHGGFQPKVALRTTRSALRIAALLTLRFAKALYRAVPVWRREL